MFFFIFSLFCVIFRLSPPCAAYYTYPLWVSDEDAKTEEFRNDGGVTEFLLQNFLLPSRDAFCMVYGHFLKVYECSFHCYQQLRESYFKKPASYLQTVLKYIGFAEQPKAPLTCSLSISVATTVLLTCLFLFLTARRMAKYTKKEQQKIFLHVAAAEGDFGGELFPHYFDD